MYNKQAQYIFNILKRINNEKNHKILSKFVWIFSNKWKSIQLRNSDHPTLLETVPNKKRTM